MFGAPKMKKKILWAAVVFAAASVFAYNPPAGGMSLYRLSSPTQFASAASSAGGGLFMPGPDSIAFNPALTALEQRSQLDAGFTALISTDSLDSHKFNAAFQTGILVPTKRFVASGFLNGVFCDSVNMDLANSLNLHAALSKEITENFSIGLGLNGGFLWGAHGDNDKDWSLGADVGVLYHRESLGFLKNFRVGGALLNLGKYYDVDVVPIDKEKRSDMFPSFVTVRAGVASVLVDTKQFNLGFSFDVSTPCFRDVAFDVGLQFSVKDTFFLSVAETIDVMEIKNSCLDVIPAVSLGVKFNLTAKNSDYLRSRSWDSSEMLVSAAWQQKYENIQAVSAGARIYLGQQDTQPPVIQLWTDED